MKAQRRTLTYAIAIAAIATSCIAASQGSAVAANGGLTNFTCAGGTVESPTTLAGSFGNVTVKGNCAVNAGSVTVNGTLTVAPGASLAQIFGQDDVTHSGSSNLVVHGNMVVDQGASVMAGCYPQLVTLWFANGLGTTPDFPCVDDPNQSNPTLSARLTVDGSLISDDPLGTVIHNAQVRGDVRQSGGGAGLGCAAASIFNQYFGLPEYSDYANVQVGGSFLLTGLDSCWFAAVRNTVHGSMTVTSNTGTPDANEVVTNTVYGSLRCQGNNPAVQLGDSDGSPNRVGGSATGECGFGVLLENPPPEVGLPVPPVLQHISVPLN